MARVGFCLRKKPAGGWTQVLVVASWTSELSNGMSWQDVGGLPSQGLSHSKKTHLVIRIVTTRCYWHLGTQSEPSYRNRCWNQVQTSSKGFLGLNFLNHTCWGKKKKKKKKLRVWESLPCPSALTTGIRFTRLTLLGLYYHLISLPLPLTWVALPWAILFEGQVYHLEINSTQSLKRTKG